MIPAGSWLLQRASVSPAHPALELEGRSVSYAELAELAGGAARWLRAQGVQPGDRVAALLPNGLRFAELLHAVSICGASLLPLNTRLAPGELAFAIRDSGPRLFLYDEGPLAGRARQAAAGLPEVCALPLAGGPDPLVAPAFERLAPPAARPDPDATLAVLYTSGTTGAPKGAELTPAGFFWSAVASAFHLGVSPHDRWLACLPFYHVGGLSILLRATLYGIPAAVHERFDPERASRALDRDGVTLLSLVPTMLARILDVRRGRPAPPHLRCVLLGGAPAPAPLLEAARALGFPIARTYGLTEAASQVATSRPGAKDDRLVPLLGTELRIRRGDGEGEDVEPAPPGDTGEILVRGPTLMRGYLNRPGDTARALRGGWLHTGDLGALDPDGALHVFDRRSDLIVSGGENVYPAEVEAALLEHPAVWEAGVAGRPDREYGARPVAWLVGPGPRPSDSELRTFCRERLASYKVPAAFHWTDSLPRNASGKLLRPRL